MLVLICSDRREAWRSGTVSTLTSYNYIKIFSLILQENQLSIFLPCFQHISTYDLLCCAQLYLLWQIDIIMNSNQKGPINPEELFRRLMGADFRQAECVDEASKLRQQREILLQLNLEYEEEIRKVSALALQEEDLLAYRQKLMVELESLRTQRQAIDARVGEEINTLRLTPVEVRSHSNLITELEHVRGCNSKIKIRIRDLMGYISSLQAQNRRLQEERQVITVNEMQRRQAGQDWRSKINLLQREHLSYQQEVRMKMKSKEAQVLRSIQAQEMEIKERNRVRMQSFREGKRSPMSTPYHRLDTRQEEYFRKA